LNFLVKFYKNQISKFMKIRQVGAEMFHAEGWTEGHDEANSRFSQVCERPKNSSTPTYKAAVRREKEFHGSRND
jgi:hypothetical protein